MLYHIYIYIPGKKNFIFVFLMFNYIVSFWDSLFVSKDYLVFYLCINVLWSIWDLTLWKTWIIYIYIVMRMETVVDTVVCSLCSIFCIQAFNLWLTISYRYAFIYDWKSIHGWYFDIHKWAQLVWHWEYFCNLPFL